MDPGAALPIVNINVIATSVGVNSTTERECGWDGNVDLNLNLIS